VGGDTMRVMFGAMTMSMGCETGTGMGMEMGIQIGTGGAQVVECNESAEGDFEKSQIMRHNIDSSCPRLRGKGEMYCS